MRHTFSVFVDDEPGVLDRVASLFRRRAFNIESLTVGRTERPGTSRMTVVVEADDQSGHRIEANLRKLIPVQRVDDLTAVPAVARDLALVRISAAGDARLQVQHLVTVYRARIVDVGVDSLMIEATGTEDKIDSLIEVLRPYGVLEVVRTGRVSMARGDSKRPTRSKGEEDDGEDLLRC